MILQMVRATWGVLVLIAACRTTPPNNAPAEHGTALNDSNTTQGALAYAMVDLSTPDRALKSYWHLQDLEEGMRDQFWTECRGSELFQELQLLHRSVLSGDALDFRSHVYTASDIPLCQYE